MNIYDFDNTIYDGDSTYDFLKYSFKKYPFLFIKSCFKTIIPIIKYILDRGGIEEVKTNLFSFMNEIPNQNKYVKNFCLNNKKKIKKWYLDCQKENDVIISASLDIWLVPFCKMIGINNLICTKTDDEFKIVGNNCKGKEKMIRLKQWFSNFKIDNAYSDSLSDIPMLEKAKKGYIVKNDNLILFDKKAHIKKNKLFNKDFLIFAFCGGISTLINFIISSLSSIFFDPVISYLIAYFTALTISYFLNIALIWKTNKSIKTFVKFILSYIPNFIILVSCVYIFINKIGINKILVYGMVAILALPITFVCVKLFAFNRRRKIKNEK